MPTFISHREWSDQVCEQHDAEKPFAPENGEALKFKAGDAVVVTNDNGVEFSKTVTGLYKPSRKCSLYARGYRYLLDWDCHWMPVKESSLRAR